MVIHTFAAIVSPFRRTLPALLQSSNLRFFSQTMASIAAKMDQHLLDPITVVDPEIYDLMKKEKIQQTNAISLIASENQTSRAVLDALCKLNLNKKEVFFPHFHIAFCFLQALPCRIATPKDIREQGNGFS